MGAARRAARAKINIRAGRFAIRFSRLDSGRGRVRCCAHKTPAHKFFRRTQSLMRKLLFALFALMLVTPGVISPSAVWARAYGAAQEQEGPRVLTPPQGRRRRRWRAEGRRRRGIRSAFKRGGKSP